ERIRPFLPGDGQAAELRVLAPHLKERLHRLSEVRDQVDFLFVGEIDLERQMLEKQGSEATPLIEALRAARHVLNSVEPFDESSIGLALEAEVEERGWKKRPAFMPIRVAISGKEKTPPLFPMLAALGRARAVQRLEDAIDLLSD